MCLKNGSQKKKKTMFYTFILKQFIFPSKYKLNVKVKWGNEGLPSLNSVGVSIHTEYNSKIIHPFT